MAPTRIHRGPEGAELGKWGVDVGAVVGADPQFSYFKVNQALQMVTANRRTCRPGGASPGGLVSRSRPAFQIVSDALQMLGRDLSPLESLLGKAHDRRRAGPLGQDDQEDHLREDAPGHQPKDDPCHPNQGGVQPEIRGHPTRDLAIFFLGLLRCG
jgi:hypothetical protein